MAYFNGIVKNSAKEISNVLGKWHNTNDYKTLREWCGTTKNNVSFYIYDYNSYKNIKENERYDYHIGTLTENGTKDVIEYLKSLGLNATFDKFSYFI